VAQCRQSTNFANGARINGIEKIYCGDVDQMELITGGIKYWILLSYRESPDRYQSMLDCKKLWSLTNRPPQEYEHDPRRELATERTTTIIRFWKVM